MGKQKRRDDLLDILIAWANYKRQQTKISNDESQMINAIDQMVKRVNRNSKYQEGLKAEIKRLQMALIQIHWVAKNPPYDQLRFEFVNEIAMDALREPGRDHLH